MRPWAPSKTKIWDPRKFSTREFQPCPSRIQVGTVDCLLVQLHRTRCLQAQTICFSSRLSPSCLIRETRVTYWGEAIMPRSCFSLSYFARTISLSSVALACPIPPRTIPQTSRCMGKVSLQPRIYWHKVRTSNTRQCTQSQARLV